MIDSCPPFLNYLPRRKLGSIEGERLEPSEGGEGGEHPPRGIRIKSMIEECFPVLQLSLLQAVSSYPVTSSQGCGKLIRITIRWVAG